MTIRRSLAALAAVSLALAAASPALGHGEVMEVGSSAPGSGVLRLAAYDFAEKVVVTPQSVGASMTLYTSIFPSFQFITADQPGTPLYQLPEGTRLTLQIACDGAVCIDAGASVRLDRIADATGETASIGEVAAGEHVHPEWRLLLPNDVFGDYRLPFRITTSAAGYTQSQVYTVTITNIAPPTPTDTPTGTTATPSPTPTATSTPIGPLTCPATPDARSCGNGPRGKLLLKANDNPDRRSAVWAWKQGPAGDFGDPTVDRHFAWCVYDETGAAPALVLSAALPVRSACTGGPCWQRARRGWQYADPTGSRGGVTKLSLKEVRNGRGVIILKARGPGLGPPPLPLAQSPLVRVRLLGGTDQCWETVLPAPAKRNDAAQFLDLP